MKRYLVILCIMVVTVLICPKADSAVSGVQQGTSEIGGYGSLQSISGGGTTIKLTTIAATYGYFLTDEIQLNGTILYVGAGDGTTTSLKGLDLQGKYHFYQKGQTAIPYVGIQLGSIATEDAGTSSTSTSYGAMGGLKYFISENTSVNPELNYRSYQFSGVSVTSTALLVGFSVYFGK